LRWLNVSGELIENREWRPLLTVETEMNGDSKSTNEIQSPLLGRPFLSMCLWVNYGMLGYDIENHPLYLVYIVCTVQQKVNLKRFWNK
jgi:hypothetical protein